MDGKLRISGGTRAHQRALTEVAVDILRNGPGQRITTSLQLQERLEVGSGTVQKALRQLIDAGAVRLRVKGHQGTLIEEYDPALLWRAADLDPLRLTLTPPGSVETTAIATEIRSQLAEYHVATEFDFMRGAKRRLDTLAENRPRVAALSMGAAQGLGVMGNPDYSTLDLGRHTYYRPETLVVLRAPGIEPADVKRVARDLDSYDHEKLTDVEFPDAGGFEYVDCTFSDVPRVLLSGRADAGVWHQVVSVIPPALAGLAVAPVNWHEDSADAEAISHAVLVWRSDFPEIAALLGLLDDGAIRERLQQLALLGIESPVLRDAIPWL